MPALRWPLILLLGAAVTVCAQEAYEPTLKWLSTAQIEQGLQVHGTTIHSHIDTDKI